MHDHSYTRLPRHEIVLAYLLLALMPLQNAIDELELISPKKGKQIGIVRRNDATSDNGHKIRAVDVKEALANIGIGWLHDLKTVLEERVEEQPEPCRKWISEIQRILDRCQQRPNVTIALYGATGSGKSSIISAICDRPIVHCNAMQAGTQFITVIGYNHQATVETPWRGEIQTISDEEWASELQILLGDLHDLPDGELPSSSSSTDAGYAIAKILAVYPEANRDEFRDWTVGELINHADLRPVLGHVHHFSGRTLTVVKKQMEKFTGSRSRPRYSPLISIMKIFGPIDFLRRGLEIADVPGSGDSNAARCRVAEQYQSKVDAFWIVSPIVRAVDDNVAKEHFGTAWKQMMQLDGKLTEEYITFVMTKCDDITVSQVIKDLDMAGEEEVVSLRAQDRSVDKLIRKESKRRDRLYSRIVKKQEQVLKCVRGDPIDLPASGESSPDFPRTPQSPRPFDEVVVKTEPADNSNPKRSREDAGGNTESSSKRRKPEDNAVRGAFLTKLNIDLLTLDSQISKLKDQKRDFKSQLTKLAICARNTFSMERIRASFSKEVNEEVKSTQTIAELPSPKPGTLHSAQEVQHKNESKQLPVFCVSTKAYEQHCRRNVDDQRVEGFPHVDDTQILQLREHCIAAASSAQEKFIEKFSYDFESIVTEFKRWAEDKEPEATISAKEKGLLIDALTNPLTVLSQDTSKFAVVAIENIRVALKNRVQDALEDGAAFACQESSKVVAGWFRKNGGLNWGTVRACARRRGGPHKTSAIKYRTGLIELNAELAEPFHRKMTTSWLSVFDTLVPAEADRVKLGIGLALDHFLDQMETVIATTCPKMSFKWELLRPMLDRMIDPTISKISASFETFLESSKNIHRSIQKRISKAVRVAYDECGANKGIGCALRNRDILTEHIRTVSSSMFNNGKTKMIGDLVAAFETLKAEILQSFQPITKEFRTNYKHMVITGSQTDQSEESRARKNALQSFILEDITKLEEAKAEVVGTRNGVSRTRSNVFVDKAWGKVLDSSAQVGEDDYVSEDTAGSDDEFDSGLPDGDDSDDDFVSVLSDGDDSS